MPMYSAPSCAVNIVCRVWARDNSDVDPYEGTDMTKGVYPL